MRPEATDYNSLIFTAKGPCKEICFSRKQKQTEKVMIQPKGSNSLSKKRKVSGVIFNFVVRAEQGPNGGKPRRSLQGLNQKGVETRGVTFWEGKTALSEDGGTKTGILMGVPKQPHRINEHP